MNNFFMDDEVVFPQKFEDQIENWEKIEEANRELQFELNSNFEKKDISKVHLKKASIAGSIFNDSYVGNIQDVKNSRRAG